MTFAIEPLAIERQNLDHYIKEMTKRRDELDKQIAEAFPKDDKYALDGVIVEVSTWTGTDYNAVAEQYPSHAYPQLYSLKIDTDRVKDAFAPAALKQFEKTGRRSVKVKVLEEAS